MASKNYVLLIGRLGKDPELKYLQDGHPICEFSLATSETWKDKASGEKKEKTEWHQIVAWGRLADICGELLQQGDLVCVDGKIETQKWETESGEMRKKIQIVAKAMQLLASRKHGASGKGTQDNDDVPF